MPRDPGRRCRSVRGRGCRAEARETRAAARTPRPPSSQEMFCATASLANRTDERHLAARLALAPFPHPFELHHVAGDDAFHEVPSIGVVDEERNRIAVEHTVLDEEHA